MKPGDRVHYTPGYGGRPQVATLYKEAHGEALIGVSGVAGTIPIKVPTYQLSPIPVESPRIPEAVAALIPKPQAKSSVVSAFVVLHEGRRLGWKILQGHHEPPALDSRYYGEGPERPPHQECGVRSYYVAGTEAWECAQAWCASFPAHPAESGSTPGEGE